MIPAARHAVLLLAAVSIVLAPSASGGRAGKGEPRASCGPEAARLCAGAGNDEDELLGCLMRHRAEVSGRCAGGIAARSVRTWGWRRACRSDVARFCSTVPPADEATLACLDRHAAKLAPGCSSRLAAIGDWAERMRGGAERFERETGEAPP